MACWMAETMCSVLRLVSYPYVWTELYGLLYRCETHCALDLRNCRKSVAKPAQYVLCSTSSKDMPPEIVEGLGQPDFGHEVQQDCVPELGHIGGVKVAVVSLHKKTMQNTQH